MASNRILGNPIPLELIRATAPSVFAEKPAEHVSPNYKFVPTIHVIETMMAKGWEPIAAKQQRTRNIANRELTKHSVIMRYMGLDGDSNMVLGGLYPTLTLVNSHNWASRLEFIYGMLRLICSNGLSVRGPEFGGMSVRHDKISEDVEAIMRDFHTNSSKMIEEAMHWHNIALTMEAATEFARAAAILRFGEVATMDHVLTLLMNRRYQDADMTLWNIYNSVQENAVKGGYKSGAMKRRIRGITNIGSEIQFNTGLYDLASKVYNANKIIVN
jgi:hypothetical protein